MGRKAFGEDRMMQAILEAAEDKGAVDLPIARLSDKTGLCEPTVKKYLDLLAAKGLIRAETDGGGTIRQIAVLNGKTAAANQAAPPKAPAAEADSSLTVALVDYDNVLGAAREADFGVSLARLKALLREHGRILFADVFLSPASTKPEIIAKLWEAGFQVIACPMESKDKDSVDAKIIWRARQYLERTPMNKLIIVSRDHDFRGLIDEAADMGKTTVFVNVLKERAKIEGNDIAPAPPSSRIIERFTQAIRCLCGNLPGPRPEGKQQVLFVKDIIRTIHAEERQDMKLSFASLADLVYCHLQNRCNGFTQRDIKAALTALVDAGAITANKEPHRTFYTLNLAHSAFMNAIAE